MALNSLVYAKKCLLLEIDSVTKFLLFRMKYIIDEGVYLIIDTYKVHTNRLADFNYFLL